MKTTCIIAGFASLLIACNSNSGNHSRNHDSSNRMAHHKSSSDTNNQGKLNPVTEIMNGMMDEMHAAKPTGNNDMDFATMMLAHHKGAVDMSKVEVDKGNNTELKAFAQQVIHDQNKEIKLLQDFISEAGKTTSSNSREFQEALSHSMLAMMSGNTTPLYNDIDSDFAAQMIPHHQSAVDMAKAYLQYGKETSLTTLCKNIINSQTKEIQWLREWLGKNTE